MLVKSHTAKVKPVLVSCLSLVLTFIWLHSLTNTFYCWGRPWEPTLPLFPLHRSCCHLVEKGGKDGPSFWMTGCHLSFPPPKYWERIENLFYKFLYDGKRDKINRKTLICPYEQGGYKMLDITSHNIAIKTSWLIKAIESKGT